MIYYDITDVLEYARFNSTLSGIQRVSIQLINHIVNKYGSESLRLIAFHPQRKRIASFDASYFTGDYFYSQDNLAGYFGLGFNDKLFKSHLKRKYKNKAKRRMHYICTLIVNKLTSMIADQQLSANNNIDVPRLSNGDIVFLGGATWSFDVYMEELARQRTENGVKLYQYIHDLIPLLTPEHVAEGLTVAFHSWLKRLSKNTDLFLTNSLATKKDLDTWLAENGANVESRVVTLAHQFADVPRLGTRFGVTEDQIRAHVRSAARLPYVLCVGTIESRKNVWTLANVWQQVHAKLGYDTPRLLFAGKYGWLKEDFDDFMRGTGSLCGYIRIVDRPCDAELAFLYRNCLFSVFPSYKEGWGLPIGECMWFGRPVITSNVSSMPEVGGDLVDYIDPFSPRSIETGVLRMISNADYREERARAIAAAPLRTWSNVADDIWRELNGVDPGSKPSVDSHMEHIGGLGSVLN